MAYTINLIPLNIALKLLLQELIDFYGNEIFNISWSSIFGYFSGISSLMSWYFTWFSNIPLKIFQQDLMVIFTGIVTFMGF